MRARDRTVVVARGMASLLTLFGLVAGIPTALLFTGRVPLPEHAPSLDEIERAFSQPDDGSLLIGALALIAWLAWAAGTLTTLVETVATARGRNAPRLRGLGAIQKPVASLVTAVAVLFLTTPPITSASVVATPLALTQPATEPSIINGPVHHVADPVQHDVAEPARSGDSGHPTYPVAPHDTLWDIARRYLGHPLRYQEIADLNMGRPQPPGVPTFTDPHWINPGMRLLLPADAHGPGLEPPATTTPAPSDPEQPSPPPSPSPPTEQPAPPIPTIPSTEPAPASPTPPPETPSPPPTPTPAPASPSPSPQATSPTTTLHATGGGDDSTEQNSHPVPIALIGGGLLAAGLLATLRARRRRQQRARRPGRHIPTPGPEAARTEHALRQAAGEPDPRRLDLATRALSAAIAADPDTAPPHVVAARLTADDVSFLLGEPHHQPPAPFTASPDGLTWTLPSTSPLPDTGDDHLAPLPALVTVATEPDGSSLLLDLEGIGALTLTGDPDRVSDLVRFIVAELAHNPWSHALTITLVGVGPELVPLAPDRIRYTDHLDDHPLITRLDHTHTTRQDLGLDDILTGRATDTAGDAWMPTEILICAPTTDDDTHALGRLASAITQDGRALVALITTTSLPEPAWTLTVHPDGTLTIPPLRITNAVAQRLPADLVDSLTQLMRTARDTSDQPIPPATEPSGWALGTDQTGQLLDTPQANPTEPDDVTERVPGEPDSAPPVESTREPVRTQALARLDLVEDRDPNLDHDIDTWLAESTPVPKIAVLGDITVTATGPRPPARLAYYTEATVCLALHPAGMSGDQIDTALWGERDVRKDTRRERLSVARTWLGTDPDGNRYLPNMNADRIYQLSEQVLVDWYLFRRLRTRAQARHHAGHFEEAITDHQRALTLVRGQPFAHQRLGGYAWLAETGHEHLTLSAILDTAHELTSIALTRDDLDLARWATSRAQLADELHSSDLPYQDLIRIAHAAGHTAEIEATVRRLLTIRDAEIEEDLHPDTYQLIHQALPAGIRTQL